MSNSDDRIKCYDIYVRVADEEKAYVEEKNASPHYGYGVRHVQAFLLFMSICVGYIIRSHLGVTIVAMTHKNKIINSTSYPKYIDSHSNISEVLNYTNIIIDLNKGVDKYSNATELINKHNGINNDSTTYALEEDTNMWNIYRTYEWSKPVQEMVLMALSMGYGTTQFPMGLISQRWGGIIPLQIVLLVNGLVSLPIPWLAVWGGWKAVCACRVLQGIAQAGLYPGVQTLLSAWVPPCERGRLSSFVYTGSTVGTVLGLQISGILADTALDWPSNFWVPGAICLIMFALITKYGVKTPSDHKTISENERAFITGSANNVITKKSKIPWTALLSSKHVWAAFITHIGTGVSFIFCFVQVPSYVHHVLGVDVKSSGILSSLPYVASMITNVIFGLLSDFCTNRNLLSVRNTRIMFNSIAQVGVAVCLAAVSFTDSIAATTTILVISMGAYSGINTGWMINYVDLAPNYSGVLMAIGNTLMSIFIMVVPILVSWVITDMSNQYQWRIIFLLVAGAAFICNAIFFFFASADVQPWNDYGYDTVEQNEKTQDSKEEPRR